MTDLVRLTPEGMHGHLARPDGEPRGAVIVCHELFGVTADIRSVVDELAAQGYLAVAPEFYHRTTAPGAVLARDDEGRALGFQHLDALTRDDALADVAATLDHLGDVPIGILGFSVGGHLAYLAATRFRVRAAAVLYAGWLTDLTIPLGRPDPTIELTPGITGELLYAVGEDDALAPAPVRAQLAAALADAHIEHELVVYPGVGHAFFWPGTVAYHPDARADVWQRVVELYQRRLSGN